MPLVHAPDAIHCFSSAYELDTPKYAMSLLIFEFRFQLVHNKHQNKNIL